MARQGGPPWALMGPGPLWEPWALMGPGPLWAPWALMDGPPRPPVPGFPGAGYLSALSLSSAYI